MSAAPVSKFSKLSIESMPPTTRSQRQRHSQEGRDVDESSSDPESDSGGSDVEDDALGTIRSPTKLTYKIDGLSQDAQAAVRDAFKDPPKISLQYCRLKDDVYAFQMTEMVPRSIRIRSPDSGSPDITCSCERKSDIPCKHLLWLMDQLVKQTLYSDDPGKPLTLTARGYAEEVGDPFQDISSFHLDVLADGLHCEAVTPESGSDHALNPHRVQEAREILSGLSSTSPEKYRPDIFDNPTIGKKILKRNDMAYTLFRVLLSNNDFFHYFRSLSHSTDPINDPFRKLEQRIDHVLQDLDQFSASPPSAASAEGPCDVIWAARHILGVVALIRTSIFWREQPLEYWERLSAARTLVRILSSVVDRNKDVPSGAARIDRNLYLRLIGDRDKDFIIGVLNLLPDTASQFVHNLEVIQEKIGVHGAPASYVEKFNSLLSRLRSQSSGAGSKRQAGAGQGRDSKRGRSGT